MNNYAEYLNSPHWQSMRRWALERADNRCQLCCSTTRLHVHHNTYERVGCENPADLVVLCDECHSLFHGRMKQNEGPAGIGYSKPTIPKLGAERTLLLLLTKNREFIAEAAGRVEARDFVNPFYRAIFQALCAEPDLAFAPPSMSAQTANMFTELLGDPEEIGHATKVLEDCLNRLANLRSARDARANA